MRRRTNEDVSSIDGKMRRALIILLIVFSVVFVSSCNLGGNSFGVVKIDNEQTNVEQDKKQDKNIYLYEEACFAGEVYFTVKEIEIQNTPSFALILTIDVEQRCTDLYKNNIDITSDMFTIKSTNNATKKAIGALYISVLGACVEAGIGAILGDSPEVIDVVSSVVENYIDEIPGIIEEAQSSFKIKAQKNQFQSFKPREQKGVTTIKVKFDFTEEQLNTERLIMLEINDGEKNSWHFKRMVYLIPRPESDNSAFRLKGLEANALPNL